MLGEKYTERLASRCRACSHKAFCRAMRLFGSRRLPDEMIDPEPGERAESDFEGAGPVDSADEGIGSNPAFDLPFDFA